MIPIHVKQAFSNLLVIPVFAGIAMASAGVQGDDYPSLTNDQAQWLGNQIYSNECGRRAECLTAWNAGEDFPSMGIGHFIWYRKGQEEIYSETFPALLRFMQDAGVSIPGWLLEEALEAPWENREAFLADSDSARMRELRTFLGTHTGVQTAFIISRFENALAHMLDSVDTGGTDPELNHTGTMVRARLENNFYRVAASTPPYGLYALVDYVNFKGTGISPLESYKGQGWGLKQVLLGMDEDEDALSAFIGEARNLLSQRVDNAPQERDESRWLAGWNNRLNTYQPEPPGKPVLQEPGKPR